MNNELELHRNSKLWADTTFGSRYTKFYAPVSNVTLSTLFLDISATIIQILVRLFLIEEKNSLQIFCHIYRYLKIIGIMSITLPSFTGSNFSVEWDSVPWNSYVRYVQFDTVLHRDECACLEWDLYVLLTFHGRGFQNHLRRV